MSETFKNCNCDYCTNARRRADKHAQCCRTFPCERPGVGPCDMPAAFSRTTYPLLLKHETTEGTDPSPAPDANAIVPTPLVPDLGAKVAPGAVRPLVRAFDTGATRDVDDSKLDYEGFLSPAVLERYAQYMHGKRRMADGTMRDGDNWQKGIPAKSYVQSLLRHAFDVWKLHRGLPAAEDEETALCAAMFNAMGKLHEVLKAKR